MSAGRDLHPTILREYDIRGIVGETLNPEDVAAIARAYGSMLVEAGGNRIALGYDGRLHSPELEAAASEGLMSCGLTVLRVGRGPSPMSYFGIHHFEADAGMMITGSHNPPEYNGIKMTFQGRAFFGDDIQQLGRRAAAGDFATGEGRAESHDIRELYVARMLRDYSGDRPLKVAWDPANGAAGEVTERLVAQLPGEHFVINGEIDGTFPSHHPDPTVEANLDQLKALVAEKECDLGIGFDGDGDRIGVVDGQGRVLWGDQLLVILARDVLADQPGATIIADVKASQVFQDEITRLGGKPLLWKTGHSHLKSKLAETGAPLAGEMSAHIFFKHRYYGYDDAVYSAIRLLSVLAGGDESLADIRDSLPPYINTPELRFDCAEERKFQVIEEVRERLQSVAGSRVNDIDGVRVETDDGWWLLRASNTQAVLVARCESTSDEGLGRLKAALDSQLRESGIEPPVL
ncbi:MAG: phosphomannomutase/phosphoglucomutase [Rhodospirillaceae bacterium]|jgi:phosphomannomutase|nr:phosphomannomutase/phosphoglucomutase [Rhodospirillaceae bacterium]